MPKKPTLIEPIDTSFDNLTKISVMSNKAEQEQEIKPVNYEQYNFHFDEGSETIWGTQEQIASVFEIDKSGISKHIKNILNEKELDESSIAKFAIDTPRGKYPVEHYNLDMIIAIGYRINSKKATEFRKWATNVLSQYIKDGYVIDEKRLTQDPEKLNKIAAKIRELRNNEKNIYEAVRQCFKVSAKDYDKDSNDARNFYSLLQDKFHYAITGMTAARLILDRADHTQDKMGLQSMQGQVPTSEETKVGKNFVFKDELYRMHLLSEQFLLHAESMALRNKRYKMFELHKKLDELLQFNEYPVFEGHKIPLKDDAERHAKREYELYQKIQKLRYSGIDVNLEDFYDGMYKDQYDELNLEHKRLSTLKTKFEEKKQEELENKKEDNKQIN